MLAQYLDLTDEITLNGYCVFETSNYDYAVIQLVNPGGTINFYSTIDSGAIQGVSDGNAESSTNYFQIPGTDLATGNDTNGLGTDGMVKFGVVGRYIKLQGSISPNKLLVMLTKIS